MWLLKPHKIFNSKNHRKKYCFLIKIIKIKNIKQPKNKKKKQKWEEQQ